MHIHMDKFDFSFAHGKGVVHIRKVGGIVEAKARFQERLNYWPGEPVYVRRHVSR